MPSSLGDLFLFAPSLWVGVPEITPSPSSYFVQAEQQLSGKVTAPVNNAAIIVSNRFCFSFESASSF